MPPDGDVDFCHPTGLCLLAFADPDRNLELIDCRAGILPPTPECERDMTDAMTDCFEGERPLARRTDRRVRGQLEFRRLGGQDLFVEVVERPTVSRGRCLIEANQDRFAQLGVNRCSAITTVDDLCDDYPQK